MDFEIRKARVADVPLIYELLNHYANRDLMLPRSLSELYDVIRAFNVAFPVGKADTLAGACALHVCWADLGEVRSLSVAQQYQGYDLGRLLLEAVEKDARDLGLHRMFVLTYIPEYFKKFGYTDIDKAELPHKIWADCLKCVKFPECGEVALEKKL
ncbi:MAG: N-acetyltransferase [Thermodesulfobacteriota bacterium]